MLPPALNPFDLAARPLPKSPLDWLRLWFRLEGRVDRREYVLSGVGLMLFKYVV
jgi:hypothetical protein